MSYKAASKATLRHIRTQLIKLKKECRPAEENDGEDAEAERRSNLDPIALALEDAETELGRFAEALTDLKVARLNNEEGFSERLADVHRLLTEVDKIVERMRSYITEREARAGTYHSKNNPEKRKKYERKMSEVRNFKDALGLINARRLKAHLELEEEHALQRSWVLRLRERLGMRAPLRSVREDVVVQGDALLQQSVELARHLHELRRTGDGTCGANAAVGNMPITVDLNTAPETREAYQEIKRQHAQMERELKDMSKSLDRMYAEHLKVQEEIRRSGVQLERAAENLAVTTGKVSQIVAIQNEVLAEESPLQFCCSCLCFCIILGLLGYLLYRFNVIQAS